MFSPVGYTAILSLVSVPDFDQKDVIPRIQSSLASLSSVYASDASGNLMKMNNKVLSDVLSSEGREFLYVDHHYGTITLDKIRSAVSGKDKDNLELGLAVATSFHATKTQMKFPETLIPYEGWSLVISDTDVDGFRDSLATDQTTPTQILKKVYSKRELEKEYCNFLAPFISQNKWPTEDLREEWRRTFDVSRQRERDLWKQFKPTNVRPGAPLKT